MTGHGSDGASLLDNFPRRPGPPPDDDDDEDEGSLEDRVEALEEWAAECDEWADHICDWINNVLIPHLNARG
jgi:hypothetical protein